ncbi:ANL family adenylate-forming protein [Lichenibacterium dinghuense]|uniref:ANL family adenylate-forming protein n=1 Tax=Lichenibacterium dinghuense TaxID=2895977 RepID=UPI001F424671|nr:long-chain fatty acid--CoA ligase [Lichenibacterium sp. 6Y81]
MPQAAKPLRRWLLEAEPRPGRAIHAPGRSLPLDDLRASTSIGPLRGALGGRSVLVATGTQIAAGLALIELDGLARRVVLAPPDLKPSDLPGVVAGAAIDAVVCDGDHPSLPGGLLVAVPGPLSPLPPDGGEARDTEWVMLTSGTTGTPKMVVHSRAGLVGAIDPAVSAPVWGTFYDIRRYGGLQIFLRAVLGGGSLVLSEAGEPVADHLGRLARHGVTHLSGTPSHWRRALMAPEAASIAPRAVRLSGEIADQAVLDALARAYPNAALGHAYASTEAGVGFEVTDGLEGFPASFLDPGRAVAMKVEDGSLRIRSARTASRYIGGAALADPEGYVDTDDLVERRGERMHFVGRRSGVINVGGLKVHPEEVEAVINRHAGVRMSLVKARANPITGAIVVADVVAEAPFAEGAKAGQAALKAEILDLCRATLPAYKVPVLLRFADGLAVTPAGKLQRHHA